MVHVYGFEKLQVWQDTRILIVHIYKVTNLFPSSEKFCLTNQIRRASISVLSNLAEGSGRNTSKDQAQFYQIAYSSLLELLNQLILAVDLQYLSEIEMLAIRTEIQMISFKINSLRNSCFK